MTTAYRPSRSTRSSSPNTIAHAIEKRRVVRGVREVVGGIGDHRVVGPPVGVRLGERAHRPWSWAAAGCRAGRSRRSRPSRPPASGSSASASPTLQLEARRDRTPGGHPGPRSQGRRAPGPSPSRSADRSSTTLLEDRGPARIELDPDGSPRPTRDRRTEQRPADAREWIEDELAGPAEELDQARHQPRRLVRAVRLALRVARAPTGRPSSAVTW